MEKKEILKALDALKAEVEKKPEDKVLEKLDEILKTVQAQGWNHYHVCQPCYLPHYQCQKPHYPSWGYYYGYTGNVQVNTQQLGTLQQGVGFANGAIEGTLTAY